jgi:hypothetical protein
MTVDKFKEKMEFDLNNFVGNMKQINQNEKTFLEHFKHFERWMEIGTYMESEYYPDGNPVE